MKVACKTDKGKKRKNNEDNVRVDGESGIFLLADGMGGHQAGEIASEIAVHEAYSYIKEKVNKVRSVKGIARLLVEALFKAHDAIKEKAKTDFDLAGMGTTLVELIIKGGKAFISHTGDSRVYLLRSSKMKQITNDQTMGNYLVSYNIMKPEDVPPSKWHTLTQAVGLSESLVPELNQIELKKGDYLLLCTDGLTDMLTDKEIEKIILKNNDNIEATVGVLIKEANKKGGVDNITVILVKI